MSKLTLTAPIFTALLLFPSCSSTEFWRQTGSDTNYMSNVQQLAITAFEHRGTRETQEVKGLRWSITAELRKFYANRGHEIELIGENVLFENLSKQGDPSSMEVDAFNGWLRDWGINAQAQTIVQQFGEGDLGFEIALQLNVVDQVTGSIKATLDFHVFADTSAEAVAILARQLAEALLSEWVKIDPDNTVVKQTDVEVEEGTGPPRSR